MSSPVTTRYTPPTACAALTSMRLMRPWAMLLRKIFPYSIPGRRRLCTYSARPVTLSQDSRRGTERPTCGVSVDCVARFMDRPCEIDADQLLLIGRRAMQVAFDLNFLGGGLAGLLQRSWIACFSLEDLLGRYEAGRLVGRRAHHDTHVVTVDHDRHAHGRPVVRRARGALQVRGTPRAQRRHGDARNELVALQRVLEVSGVQRFDRHTALAIGPGNRRPRAEGAEQGRQVHVRI